MPKLASVLELLVTIAFAPVKVAWLVISLSLMGLGLPLAIPLAFPPFRVQPPVVLRFMLTVGTSVLNAIGTAETYLGIWISRLDPDVRLLLVVGELRDKYEEAKAEKRKVGKVSSRLRRKGTPAEELEWRRNDGVIADLSLASARRRYEYGAGVVAAVHGTTVKDAGDLVADFRAVAMVALAQER